MGSLDRPYMDPSQRRRGGASSPSSCSSSAGCGCRGKDFGPLQDHEEPSEDDVERFSSATRTCSECRTEVFDDAEICHNCGHAFNRRDDGANVPTWAIATTVGLVGLIMMGLIFI